MGTLRGLQTSLAFFLSNVVGTAFSYEIIFTVQNIRNNQGYLMAALHNQSNTFPGKGGALIYIKAQAKKGVMKQKFLVETPGNYAISIFHDENNNGVLDKNLLGIPTEGYGFSNTAEPDFKKAVLHVNKETTEVTIDLKYPYNPPKNQK
ncbi:DUF2141 domain-containing protein [Endozoicomonas sp. Mp262]